MNYGIVVLPLIPGRAEPSDKAEMITQYSFGEPYKVLESTAKWKLIESAVDGYQSWIDVKQHSHLDENEYLNFDFNKTNVSHNILTSISDEMGSSTHIPLGSFIPKEIDNGSFHIGNKNFTSSGLDVSNEPIDIKVIALKFLNAPYLWGGKSILGIDCSGFTQMIYRVCGVFLPRDAYQQAETGTIVDFIDLTESGDLVFFDNTEGRITHVGMMLNTGKIIHASGKVRIDTIDHEGIFNADEKKYTHKTRIIKRLSI